jgi:Fe-S-cluster-containing dehydrogenase component
VQKLLSTDAVNQSVDDILAQLPPEIRERIPQRYNGVRTATCSALDDVELVRIRQQDFQLMIESFPAVREFLTDYAVELLQQNEREMEELGVPLGDFLEQGLSNAQRLLVLDLECCTRCDECTRACADTHLDANGEGVTRLIREGLRFDKYLVASSCRSCLDPYCMVGCPVDAIHRSETLEIKIQDNCIGCGQCANNCPYGNINMHGLLDQASGVTHQKATTCDLCRSVVGPGKEVSCVYACPHEAAFRMSGQELLERVKQRG